MALIFFFMISNLATISSGITVMFSGRTCIDHECVAVYFFISFFGVFLT